MVLLWLFIISENTDTCAKGGSVMPVHCGYRDWKQVDIRTMLSMQLFQSRRAQARSQVSPRQQWNSRRANGDRKRSVVMGHVSFRISKEMSKMSRAQVCSDYEVCSQKAGLSMQTQIFSW